MPAKPSEHYLNIPSYIAPVSFDDGVPSLNHARSVEGPASPGTSPSPSVDHPDPWSPERNKSIKIESAVRPQSQKRASKFAVAAPSSGAARFQRHNSSTPVVDSTRGDSLNELGLLPDPVAALSGSPSAATPTEKGLLSDSFMSKSLSRISKSFSGRSQNKKSLSADTPPPPAAMPQAQGNAHTSRSNSVRTRSFAIPQTLEEWEAFNRSVLERPQQPLPPLRRPFAPGGAHLRPPSMLGTSTPSSSQAGTPNGSPRTRMMELPPPPIVQAEWERRRSWTANVSTVPMPARLKSGQDSGDLPPPGTVKPNTLRKTSASAASAANPLSKPEPLPTPVPTPAPAPSTLPVEPPTLISAAETARLRTTSLPDGQKLTHAHIAPIITSPSPSLKWKRTMSWVMSTDPKIGAPAAAAAASNPLVMPEPIGARRRSTSASEIAAMNAAKRGSIVIQRDTRSNGQRLMALRKSSQEHLPMAQQGGNGVLRKRRSSQLFAEGLYAQIGSERNLAARPAGAGIASSVSMVDLSAAAKTDRPRPRETSTASTADRASHRFSAFGMKNMFRKSSSTLEVPIGPVPAPVSKDASEDAPGPSLEVRPSQDEWISIAPSNLDISASPLIAKPDLPEVPAASAGTPAEKKPRRFSLSQTFSGIKIFKKESSEPSMPAGLMLQVPTAGALSTVSPSYGDFTTSPQQLDSSPSPGAKPSHLRDPPTSSGSPPVRKSRRFSMTQAMGMFRKESSRDVAAPPLPGAPVASIGPQMQAASRTSSFAGPDMPVTTPTAHGRSATTPEGETPKGEKSALKISRKGAPSLSSSDDVAPTKGYAPEVSAPQREGIEKMVTPVSSPKIEAGERSLPVSVFKSGGKRSTSLNLEQLTDAEEKIDPTSNRVSRFLSDYAATNELGLRDSPSVSVDGAEARESSSGRVSPAAAGEAQPTASSGSKTPNSPWEY